MSVLTPLVSIVLPAYNQEKFIAQAIQSVISQSYQNLQIIIGDDCSSDNTYSIIKSYIQEDSRIEHYSNQTNQGICANFNKLFDMVRGEYVAFFSGDDIMYPQKIEQQLAVLLSNPKVVLVHHNAWVIDGEGNQKYLSQEKGMPALHPLDVGLISDWFHVKKIAMFLPTTCLARTEYYLHARYNPQLIRKHELLFTVENYYANPNGKWYYIKEPLGDYRLHEKNFTNNSTFSSFIKKERMTMPDLVAELCPGLKRKADDAKIFFVNEALLFKHYENEAEKRLYLKYLKDNASLYKKGFVIIGNSLIKIKLYWIVSKLLHKVFYKPFHYN